MAETKVEVYVSSNMGREDNLSKEEIEKRDKLDSEREVAPLKKASDAVLIDTTALGIGQVVNRIVALTGERN